METGGRRGERARCLGEDSLVTLAVCEVALATDVRRQRHRSVRIKIDIFVEFHHSFAVGQNFFDAQRHIVDLRRRADPHFAAGLDQTFPACRPDLFQKQKLDGVVV